MTIPQKMQAVILKAYGALDQLEYQEVATPTPTEHEILIRVRGTTANPVECAIRSGQLKHFIKVPKSRILGLDASGEVLQVGSKVTRFKVGDEVMAFIHIEQSGAYAEYATIHEDWATKKPNNWSFLEAGVASGVGMTAYDGLLKHGQLKAGEHVLINGAAGGVGHLAVQIARAIGAEVTATCSTPKVEWVKSLGAHRVLDYKKVDVYKTDLHFDVVFDCVGERTVWAWRKHLNPGGRHVMVAVGPIHMLMAKLAPLLVRRKSSNFYVTPNGKSLETLAKWAEEGKLRPYIEKIYTFQEIRDAQARVETGRTQGKVAIQIS